jgi:hypothetical protein
MTTLALAIIMAFAIIAGIIVSAMRWRSEIEALECHEQAREFQWKLMKLLYGDDE